MGIELALAAGAAAASKANKDHANKKRGRVAAQGLEAQQAVQREIDGTINRHVTGLRQSSPHRAQAEASRGFLETLRANRANAVSGTGGIGGLRYAADTAGAQTGVSQYGSKVAGLLSRINAAAQQRRDESRATAQLGVDVGALKKQADNEAFNTEQAIGKIEENPWVDIGAGLLGGAASTFSGKTKPRKPKETGPSVPGTPGPRE